VPRAHLVRKPLRGCGLRWQPRHEGQRIVGAFKPAKIEDRGYQHKAFDPYPFLVLQSSCEFWRAKAAIALANDEFRADEPFVGREPFPDGDGKGLYIALGRIKMAACLIAFAKMRL